MKVLRLLRTASFTVPRTNLLSGCNKGVPFANIFQMGSGLNVRGLANGAAHSIRRDRVKRGHTTVANRARIALRQKGARSCPPARTVSESLGLVSAIVEQRTLATRERS